MRDLQRGGWLGVDKGAIVETLVSIIALISFMSYPEQDTKSLSTGFSTIGA